MKNSNMEEIWKTIEGYPNYQVSSLGRIKSLERKEKYKDSYRIRKEKILKLSKNAYGYLRFLIYKEGKRKDMLVHRIVCNAFLPNPFNLPQVNHKNEIKTDNRVENLEYCDAKYNLNFGTRNKRAAISLSKIKTGVYNTKKSKAVICIETGKIFPSVMEVKRQLGLSQGNISSCCIGKRKTCGGLHWKYVD